MPSPDRRFVPSPHGALRQWVAVLGTLLIILGVSSVTAGRAPAPRVGVPQPPVQADNIEHLDFQSLGAAGTDIEFFQRDGRTYAIAAAIGQGFSIFDITGELAAAPRLVGVYASPGYQNDIQVQGNLAVLGTDEGRKPDPNIPCPLCEAFEGIELVDITNLTLPLRIKKLDIPGGAHTMTIAGNYVYVSNISRRATDIVDVRTPGEATVVRRIAEPTGCLTSPYPCQPIQLGEQDWDPHDITAVNVPGKGLRLYVAAIEGTFIVDANDPVNLKLIAKIPNPLPESDYSNLQIVHQSDLSPDGKLLVISDERGGGLTETQCPGGGLHVYDVSDEANPRKLGVYFIPYTGPGNCTVHVFRFLPDRNVLVTGWYIAGTWVVDLSGPTAPNSGELQQGPRTGQTTTWGRTLGHIIMPGADTWASKAPGFAADGNLYMYATDLGRGGMDTFKFTGTLPPPFSTVPEATVTTTTGSTSTPLPTLPPQPTITSTSTALPVTSTATRTALSATSTAAATQTVPTAASTAVFSTATSMATSAPGTAVPTSTGIANRSRLFLPFVSR